ncbi:MAG: nicotinate (nicotinamide) nucleotide adenylyltransferase [Actinobacteria bacterium]|nr:nicotinate (nicotinamide) nucleotide adenylyltransferase [Actinomycetota bacterium]
MFDPPHIGHVIVAHEAWWQLALDEVRLVPTGVPPHRDSAARFAADLRLRLARAAIGEHPGLRVWSEEVDRGGVSYTIGTLRALARELPVASVWLILGADQLTRFATWRSPDEIASLARLAVVDRDGIDRDEAEALAGTAARGRIDWIDVPPIGISSSLVRERIASGAPIRYLVSATVEAMLLGEHLYRPGPSGYP